MLNKIEKIVSNIIWPYEIVFHMEKFKNFLGDPKWDPILSESQRGGPISDRRVTHSWAFPILNRNPEPDELFENVFSQFVRLIHKSMF